MKKIVLLSILMFAAMSCNNEHKTCVRACTKAAIDDLTACSEMGKNGGDADACTRAAKKKGRECLDTCPK